jgi:hypothetical protein
VKEVKITHPCEQLQVSVFIKSDLHTILPFSQTGFIPFAILEINISDKTMFIVFQLCGEEGRPKHYQKMFFE